MALDGVLDYVLSVSPDDVWVYFTRPYVALLAVILLLALPRLYRIVRLGLNERGFECLLCGNCCRFGIIELSGDDVERIESHGYWGFYERDGKTIKLRKADGRCVFYENGLCSIHDFKPEVCGEFPFFTYLGLPYARALVTCPGIRKLEGDLRGK